MPIDDRQSRNALRLDDGEQARAPHWFVIWTQSHCERLVHDQLRGADFDVFLPTMKTWSRQRGVRRTIALPMFAGYVFVRRAMDKRSYVDIVKARGVVRILGEAWDRLTPVPDAEIDAIRRVIDTDVPVFAHPYLQAGQQVRIVNGPLTGVEGVLVQSKPRKGLLVVSVDLLQRSVAVEVDGTDVVPVSTPYQAPMEPWTAVALTGHAICAPGA